MTPDEAIKLATDLGPMILSIVGALLTSVVGTAIGLARYAWKVHNRRMAAMAETLNALAKAVGKYEETNHADHLQVWEKVKESAFRADQLKDVVMEMKGGLAAQVNRVDTYIKEMGKIEALMTAVMRFVDKIDPNAIPKRATD